MDTFFEIWIRDKLNLINKSGVEIEVSKTQRDIDNPSLRIDLDNNIYLGRITVWSSGESNMEILDQEGGETILDKHIRLKTAEDFDSYFYDFFTKMGIKM